MSCGSSIIRLSLFLKAWHLSGFFFRIINYELITHYK